jgi:hypothetical protein
MNMYHTYSDKYHTYSAVVDGAIVGHLWMPAEIAGTMRVFNLRRDAFDRFADKRGATFRDALLHILAEHGGDFQDAKFSADTVIRVTRRNGNHLYGSWHAKERELAQIPGLADLVNPEVYTHEVSGDGE